MKGQIFMFKIMAFIFGITNICDKHCEACCNRKGGMHNLKFSDFKKKIDDIALYVEKTNCQPVVGFTGGEPFFYCDKQEEETYNIKSLLEHTLKVIPECKFIIRTSGWEKNNKFNSILDCLYRLSKNTEIRMGFNLFQKNGNDAEIRLRNMIELLLKYQDSAKLDIIYNKKNIEDIISMIEKNLSKYMFPYKGIREHLLSNPNRPYRFTTKNENSGKTIIIYTYPAYPAMNQGNKNNFFEDTTSCAICSNIKYGVNHIYYDVNLSVCHCNDPFVDANIPPMSKDKFNSVSEEINYIEQKFEKLKNNFEENKLIFKNKQERCSYCTRKVLC